MENNGYNINKLYFDDNYSIFMNQVLRSQM